MLVALPATFCRAQNPARRRCTISFNRAESRSSFRPARRARLGAALAGERHAKAHLRHVPADSRRSDTGKYGAILPSVRRYRCNAARPGIKPKRADRSASDHAQMASALQRLSRRLAQRCPVWARPGSIRCSASSRLRHIPLSVSASCAIC